MIRSLSYQPPELLAACFAEERGTLLLDSALLHPELGRYSYLLIWPFAELRAKGERLWLDKQLLVGDPFKILEGLLELPLERVVELPPFQGGAAGLLGYELGHHFESLSRAPEESMPLDDLHLGLYDLLIAWDHQREAAWLISQGWPESDPQRRDQRAQARAALLLLEMERRSLIPKPSPPKAQALAQWRPRFNKPKYLQKIQEVIDAIRAGEIFQANLSLAFDVQLPEQEPWGLYKRLRATNPAPFAGFYNMGSAQLLSSSPERFIKVERGAVETRPIKGTRPRGADPQEDQRLGEELLQSEKDRAENLMIVDLMRNDLSRVCAPGSVQVKRLCDLERYASVQHLVSVVQGQLEPGRGPLDLLRASFPGGSITGAPKIRAMEIITELEEDSRGPYCGSLILLGPDGFMDSSIIIRSLILKGAQARVQAGGGIVADSDPQAEYEELCFKAQRLLALL